MAGFRSLGQSAPGTSVHVYSVIGTFRDSAGTLMLRLRNPWGTDGAGNDGLDDGHEILTVGTDPLVFDTDTDFSPFGKSAGASAS